MCAEALGNFLVSRLKASAGITARVVSSVARATEAGILEVNALGRGGRPFLRIVSGVAILGAGSCKGSST